MKNYCSFPTHTSDTTKKSLSLASIKDRNYINSTCACYTTELKFLANRFATVRSITSINTNFCADNLEQAID